MDEGDQKHDLMQYQALVRDSLRFVVKAVIEKVAASGSLPGDHHLYITFKTRAEGTIVPDDILARYPDDMTIVIQHQFWDLDPEDRGFGVTLRFGGHPKRLFIPYSSVMRLYDPSVQFLLEWPAPLVPPAEVIQAPVSSHHNVVSLSPSGDKDDVPNIVSLDDFRKK